MSSIIKIILISLVICVHTQIFSHPITGMNFTYEDWEIYCSNTGTCKAAGYQNDNDENQPASILLARKAGPGKMVQGQFALSVYSDIETAGKRFKNIHFYLNNKDLGEVKAVRKYFPMYEEYIPLYGELSFAQTEALLKYSRQHVNIVFKNEYHIWKVSDTGMTAVLLKMDDFQKRVGTQGALVKKGRLDEKNVLKPQLALFIKKVKTGDQPYLVLQPDSKAYLALRRLLRAATPKSEDRECEALEHGPNDTDTPAEPIKLYKLSNRKVLAVTSCWRAAYNEGSGAWVIPQNLRGPASYVTNSINRVESGEISHADRGRGHADCWSFHSWTWNGQRFIESEKSWSGMCKGLTVQPVWQLDLLEADIQE